MLVLSLYGINTYIVREKHYVYRYPLVSMYVFDFDQRSHSMGVICN